MTTAYKLVRNLPVADFFYKGTSHTHPVRRRVLIVEITPTKLTGYEIRNGRAALASLSGAPVKTFTRDKIAKWGDYQKLRRNPTQVANFGKSTLTRSPLGVLGKSFDLSGQ